MSQPTSSSDSLRIACSASPSFQQWLAGAGGSLCVSTYQAGKVAMIGWDGRQVTLLMRQFDKPLGLAAAGRRLALATRHVLWMFANAPPLAHDYFEQQPGRYDALYLPRATYHTGDLNAHDLAFDDEGLLLVASRFSCLARLSYDYSFEPIWKPNFVSDLVPEDRCHLNGLAIRDRRARYVTALGTTDAPGAWRENKASGGVLIDLESDEILLGGLAMPHSPRWHNGQLWMLNSGAGQLLLVDPISGQSTIVCEMPGYLRGLCFVGAYALVGLSRIREKHIFGGLPVQRRYHDKLFCGVAVVDTRSGEQVALFEFSAGCEELYDIQFLPGVLRPTILNLDRPAVYEAITNSDSSFWLRASAEIPWESGSESGASQGSVPAPSVVREDVQSHGVDNLIPDSGNQSLKD
ncbi:MAG: TIGR03032 family protein [Pirellulales bacterium]|nr:TIGR03032 family protein [Pirellulales bacterium]